MEERERRGLGGFVGSMRELTFREFSLRLSPRSKFDFPSRGEREGAESERGSEMT
jgi:hypothetical protein